MEEEIQRHERRIVNYRGNDPLKPHLDYLHYLNQNKLVEQLEKCLLETVGLFKNDERYKNDDRFLSLVLYYVKNINTYMNEKEWTPDLFGDDSNSWDKITLLLQMIQIGRHTNDPSFTETERLIQAYVGFIVMNGKFDCNNWPIHCSCKTKKVPVASTTNTEMDFLPLKVGELDNFKVPLTIPDPPDPNKFSMYCKNLVYVDDIEYSLEEIRARHPKYDKSKMIKKAFNDSKGKRSTNVRKATAPPLFNEQSHEDSECTIFTKEARDAIEEMWNSPIAPNAAPLAQEPMSTEISTNKEPFNIYNQSLIGKQSENAASKGLSVRKLQMDSTDQAQSASKPRVFGERLVTETDLATRLDDISLKPIQSTAFANLNNYNQDNDFTEVTCNTKAFEGFLISSTPFHGQAKNQMRQSEGSSDENATSGRIKTNQELSVILEASKEKYSSSSGSSGPCATHLPPNTVSNIPITPGLLTSESNVIFDEMTNIDPFSTNLTDKLLAMLNFPQTRHRTNFEVFNSNLPVMAKQFRMGNETYNYLGEIGKGSYARVVKASCNERTSAFKIEKPPNLWEYYICKEIHLRLPKHMLFAFMNVQHAFIFNNGSVLETEWACYGNLLNIVNCVKLATNKPLEQQISSYFAIQLIDIIYYLHKCCIIHGDIKPDNFVLRKLPAENSPEPCIQLIDFGRSIDMSLFPHDTTFTTVVNTEDFTCNEMKENKPWTYQTDLYGLAGTVHIFLTCEYMKVVKRRNDVWSLTKNLPRILNRDVWSYFFTTLLNIESCGTIPDLLLLKQALSDHYNSFNHQLTHTIFNNLAKILKNSVK